MIVVFGSIIVDHLFAVPDLPRRGETVLGERYSVMPGGKGANQALAAARDGARVALVGAVGSDHLATLALDGLRQAGVDVSSVRAVPAPTGAAAVGVDARGENQIMVAAGANLAVEALWLYGFLAHGNTLVLQGELRREETEAAIVFAKAKGQPVILNLAPVVALRREVLQAVDILVVNDSEAAALAAQLALPSADAPALAGALGVTVIVTLGERGAQTCSEGRAWRTPALKIEAVDTTGAGDAFVGVLAASLDRALPLDQALRRGSVAGGLACRAMGAQAALPDHAAIEAGLRLLAPDQPLP